MRAVIVYQGSSFGTRFHTGLVIKSQAETWTRSTHAEVHKSTHRLEAITSDTFPWVTLPGCGVQKAPNYNSHGKKLPFAVGKMCFL